MTPVHATRATTSPVIGHYEAIQVTDTGWGTDTTTAYRAYLADGTPAGVPITWGSYLAPATNTYDTEAKARAGIRRARRHLDDIANDFDTIRAEASRRPAPSVVTSTVHDDHGKPIGAVRHLSGGRHSAAAIAADGDGYLPLGDHTTPEEAAEAIRAHMVGVPA